MCIELVTICRTHKQKEDYPKDSSFTSHMSKFAVFPSATTNKSLNVSTSLCQCQKELYIRVRTLIWINYSSQELTPRTANALQQLHSGLYCTSTYKEHFRGFSVQNKYENRDIAVPIYTLLQRTATREQPLTLSYHGGNLRPDEVTRPKSTVMRDGGKADEQQQRGNVDCDIMPKGETFPQETCITTGEKDEHLSLEKKDEESVEDNAKKLRLLEDRKLEDEHEEEQNSEPSNEQNTGSESTVRDIELPSLVDSITHPGETFTTFTHLSQLPDHFRRIATKYTRNSFTPPWPCNVPYYLLQRHSLLPSSLTVLPTHFHKPKLRLNLNESSPPDAEGLRNINESFTIDGNGAEKEKENIESGTTMPRIRECFDGKILASVYERDLKHIQSTTKRSDSSPNTDFDEEYKLPSLSAMTGNAPQAFMVTASTGNCQTQLPIIETPRDDEDGKVPPLTTLLTPPGSRVPHRLRLRYRTEAHSR